MIGEFAYTLDELAAAVGATVRGDGSCKVHNVAPIAHAKAGEISFLIDRKYQKYLTQTKASAILLGKEFATSCPVNALVIQNPKLGFIKLLALLRPKSLPPVGIHQTAVISENCQIHPTASIGPYAVIESNVTIGARTVIGSGVSIGGNSQVGVDCCLYSRVTLYHETILGDRNIIHSGTVIGADGFGLIQDEVHHQWVSIPQVGRVVIGDDVEIGANTTIDRGTLNDTIIGNGVKIDNLVMVGHNVQIGDHTVIAGCAGVAGSTIIGRNCMIGASAGINGHITICDDVVITGMGMIQKSVTKPGTYSSGTGMQTNREWHKSVVRFWQLDELAKRLKRLERFIQ